MRRKGTFPSGDTTFSQLHSQISSAKRPQRADVLLQQVWNSKRLLTSSQAVTLENLIGRKKANKELD